jgi:heavy metal sensor kinase
VSVRIRSVRVRLTLWYVGLLGATLAVSGIVLYVSLSGPLGLRSPLSLLTMHDTTGSVGSQDDEILLATVGHLLATSILVAPLILVLGVAGGLFLAGRALDPVDRIIRTADSIRAGSDLSRRLDVAHTSDEFGRLAATLDGMFERLEAAFSRERQLNTDIAHELRTPLAAVMIQAEVALARCRAATDYRQSLQKIHDNASRLASLVDQMLQLARAETGQERLAHEQVDLSELAAELVNSMRPLAEPRGVQVTLVAPAPVLVEGDQLRLTQVLLNLTDNALRHVATGGTIELRVHDPDKSAVVQVIDSGAGIPPEHLAHIFDRFYRVDPARDRDSGGAGLGLAITSWIVQAHGGSIDVHSEVGVGTTFTVCLPRASDSSVPARPVGDPTVVA